MIASTSAQIPCIDITIMEHDLCWLEYVLPHRRQKRGGPIRTWIGTVRKDFECIDGPSIYGHRLKKEWLLLLLTMASHSAELEASYLRSRWSQPNQ